MFFIYIFRNLIEFVYVKYNIRSVSFKRDFSELSYPEKLFLTLFQRNNLFKKSIANLYSNDKLFNFRRYKYPLVFFFHLYYDKMNYKFLWLKKLIKIFNYLNRSKFFAIVFKKFKNNFFKKFKNNFVIFVILQKILYKRYYNLSSSIYFKSLSGNNLVKLNLLFYCYFRKSKYKTILYDLSKYTDWYDFNFKKKNKKANIFKKIVFDKKEQKNINNSRLEKKKSYKKMYKLYNKFFLSLYIKYNRLYRNIFCMKLNFNKSKLVLKKGWKNSLKKFYTIRFSETSVSQHISLKNINSYLFFYIRKNRIFNKGRYSRNRQLYRTGVYWCLWLNIILVYGLYFLFYRFTFNFGYFWWGILILAYSTIFSRVVKYNFYNIYYIIKEFFSLIKWFGVIFQNLNFLVVKFLKKLSSFFKSNLSFFKIIKIVLKIVNDNNRKIVYFWEPLGYKDESFLKHKSLINWFVQVYKVISH